MCDAILPFIPATLRSIALSRTRCTDKAVLHWRAMLPATAFNYRTHRDPGAKQQRKQKKRAERLEAEAAREAAHHEGPD